MKIKIDTEAELDVEEIKEEIEGYTSRIFDDFVNYSLADEVERAIDNIGLETHVEDCLQEYNLEERVKELEDAINALAEALPNPELKEARDQNEKQHNRIKDLENKIKKLSGLEEDQGSSSSSSTEEV